MKMSKLTYEEAIDIARMITGRDEETEDHDVEMALYDIYEMGDMRGFVDIFDSFYEALNLSYMPIMDEVAIGPVAKREREAHMIAPKMVHEQFLLAVIHWAGGDNMNVGDKYLRKIISDNGPVFHITIERMEDEYGDNE